MAIGDFFSNLTGGSYTAAADQQRKYLGDLTGQIGTNIGTAQTTGLDALRSGTATARQDVQTATPQAQYALTGAVDPALAAVYGGAQGAVGQYQPLYNAAQTYGQYGGQASQAQADALGLNGPEGIARAKASYDTGPADIAINRGVDALTRAANAATGGNAAGGNLYRTAQMFGQDTAQKYYDQYIQNLQARQQLYSPLQAQALAQYGAGTGTAGLTAGTKAADIISGTGGKLSDLLAASGYKLSDLASMSGQQQATLINSLAQLQTGAQTKLGEDYASTYGAEAAAKQAGAAQLSNLGMQGLTLAAGGGFLPSMAPGGGGLQFGQPFGSAAPKTNTIFNLQPTQAPIPMS